MVRKMSTEHHSSNDTELFIIYYNTKLIRWALVSPEL